MPSTSNTLVLPVAPVAFLLGNIEYSDFRLSHRKSHRKDSRVAIVAQKKAEIKSRTSL
jgi:hypothetical protein